MKEYSQPSDQMEAAAFETDSLQLLGEAYPNNACALKHTLAGHELFTIDALQELADFLDPSLVEYNRADIGIEMNPEETPSNGLSIRDTLGSIHENKSWAVLKQVQNHPSFGALLDTCLEEISPTIFPLTGEYMKREAFVFISSPGSVTPFHMDPEHNILLQISGQKFMHLFARNDERFCSQNAHEAFHAGGHRNLSYDPSFEAVGEVYDLRAGDAVYVPVTAPHWVQNGDDVSLSLSITWRSAVSRKESHLHKINKNVRKLGLRPPMPGQKPVRDKLLSGLYTGVKSAKPKFSGKSRAQ